MPFSGISSDKSHIITQQLFSILQTVKVYKDHLRDGEIDNRWVLFHKEVVLGESFDAKDEVRRQFGELEPFKKILFVGFVFLDVNKTKKRDFLFGQESA